MFPYEADKFSKHLNKPKDAKLTDLSIAILFLKFGIAVQKL